MLKKQYRASPVSLGSAKSFSTPYFSLKIAKNNLEVSRFAFVVSKKIDKRASSRNNVKRKVRGVIEEIFDKINTGSDFVFYPKEKSITATRDQIQEEIKSLFEKNKFLK